MSTFNITDVYTSRTAPDGSEAKYTPVIGEEYRLTVEFDVTGAPLAPYPVVFTMADRLNWEQVTDVTAGHKRVSSNFFLPLDGEIPWRVDVDPYHYADGVDQTKSPMVHMFPDVVDSGQHVRIGVLPRSVPKTTKTGSFEPAPPPAAIDYYGGVAAIASQMLKVVFPASGEVQRMVTMMGSPTSETWQQVSSANWSVQSGAGSTAAAPIPVDGPSQYPVYFWDESHLPAGTVSALETSLLQLHSVRVDRKQLEQVTWTQLDNARQTEPYGFYALPEAVIESDDPEITSFVHTTLGNGYRFTTTPYDAARKLFQAVLAHTYYYFPAPNATDLRPKTAKGMLEKGFGDCGGFSILLVALFRNIGFAARTAYGCWIGLDQWHCWCELYFPGHGWVVCDGSVGNGLSETGEFAYYFGNIPDLNIRFANARGNTFQVEDVALNWLQVPYEQVWGSVQPASASAHLMLIEHLQIQATGVPPRRLPDPKLAESIQLGPHRCPCAAHGGFRPVEVVRRREPAHAAPG